MTDYEQDKVEAELRRMSPATPPETLMVRLLAAKRTATAQPIKASRPGAETTGQMWLLRWLVPATAVVIVSLVLWRAALPPATWRTNTADPSDATSADVPVLKADDVQIGQELMSSFDAVARLPGGEPVRFRFQQWMDLVILSDSTHGLVVESRTPRFEVVPVGFETY